MVDGKTQMAVTQLSQKEYLKKYLSSSSDDKKKKKKKKQLKATLERFRVVDDDIDLKNMRPLDEDEIELYHLAEDAPQIAGIIDERPDDMQALEVFRGSKRWKIMSDESGIEDIKITAIGNGDMKLLENKGKDDSSIQKKEVSSYKEKSRPNKHSDLNSPPLKKYEGVSDVSPPRKSRVQKDSNASDVSPSRKSRVQRDSNASDVSPPRKSRMQRDSNASDVSLPRKSRVQRDSNASDVSPPRKSRVQRDSDASDVSPPRKSKVRKDSNASDVSPPRKLRVRRDSDATDVSPPRKSRVRRHSDAFDISPPRKSRVQRNSDASPPRKKKVGDTDESSSRKKRKSSDSDPSPPRKYKHNLELSFSKRTSDTSPLRRGKDNANLSPVRKNRHIADVSPQRRSKRDGDLSPVRKNKHSSELSPSRRNKYEREKVAMSQRNSKTDVSPLRKNKRNSDLSPPRKSKMQRDSDTSPPRRPKKSEECGDTLSRNTVKYDKSKTQKNLSDMDASPPRKSSSKHYGTPNDDQRASFSKTSRSSETTRSEKSHKYERDSLPSTSKFRDARDSVKQSKDKSFKSISTFQHHKKNESPQAKGRCRSSSLSPSRNSRGRAYSGNSSSENSAPKIPNKPRHAVSPPRSASRQSNSRGRERVESEDGLENRRNNVKEKMEKTLDGKRAGLQDAKELRQEISEFKRREDELFAQMGDEVSGRGAAAVMRDRKTGKRRNLEEEAKEKAKQEAKLAEHKEKYTRWGKGLKQVEDQKENLQNALHEMSKPLARYADDDDLERHLRNQEREGDPMLEYIRSKKGEDTTKSKPKYQGSFLPNRFGITPGHRWDGVDRSNGYEKQWFEHQNSRRAVEEEAYKWSTSDM